jgi:hypothetical protein
MTIINRVWQVKNSGRHEGFSQKKMFADLGIHAGLGNKALHWQEKRKPKHILGIRFAVEKYLDNLKN